MFLQDYDVILFDSQLHSSN